MFPHSFQISSHETSHKNEKNLIFFTQRNIIFIIFQIIFDERQGDIMYQIVDRDEILSYEDIRNEYQGYLTLVIKNGNDAGKVYATADKDGMAQIADLQSEMHEEEIDTHIINCLVLDTKALTMKQGCLS